MTKPSLKYRETLDWRDVGAAVIERTRRMSGARIGIKKKTGRAMDDSTDEQVAQYLVENAKSKILAGKLPADGRAKKIADTLQRKSLKSRMDEYRKHLNVETVNDESALRNLCQIEIVLEELETAETNLVRQLKSGTVNSDEINSIVNAKMRYSTEYRQLCTALGIDKTSREKAERERGGGDYLRELIVQGNDLLKEKSTPITCDYCKRTGTLLQMGFILCHFGGWVFSTLCPHCGQEITISG